VEKERSAPLFYRGPCRITRRSFHVWEPRKGEGVIYLEHPGAGRRIKGLTKASGNSGFRPTSPAASYSWKKMLAASGHKAQLWGNLEGSVEREGTGYEDWKGWAAFRKDGSNRGFSWGPMWTLLTRDKRTDGGEFLLGILARFTDRGGETSHRSGIALHKKFLRRSSPAREKLERNQKTITFGELFPLSFCLALTQG